MRGARRIRAGSSRGARSDHRTTSARAVDRSGRPRPSRPPFGTGAARPVAESGLMDAGLTVFAKDRFCRYDEAKIGLMTHALHYGTGCFEGVRGFWSARDEELYLFQLEQHYERIHASAKILMMKVPKTVPELMDITV